MKNSAIMSIQKLLKLETEDRQASWSTRDGESSNELMNTRLAHRELLALYGNEPAAEMTPAKLRTVQRAMCEAGLCATSVNSRVKRIRRAVRWATARMLLPPDVLQGLLAVESVRPPQAPLRPRVRCALVEDVLKTINKMGDLQRGGNVAGDICRLILLTGMRPGEVTAMRGEEIEVCPDGPWTYCVTSHKNTWRDKNRTVKIGPKAQAILRGYLHDGLLFTTKMGNKYSSHSLAGTVRKACRRAGVEPWTPNQLRHSAITKCDEVAGLACAQEMAGHSDSRQTETYLDRQSKRVCKYVEMYA